MPIAVLTLKHYSATAGASWSSGTSMVATEQMLAQQRVWRRSQLAALSIASLTGYISYTSGIINKPKKPSMYFHFEMTWRYFGFKTNNFARRFTLKTKNSCICQTLELTLHASVIPPAVSFCLIWTIYKVLNLWHSLTMLIPFRNLQ